MSNTVDTRTVKEFTLRRRCVSLETRKNNYQIAAKVQNTSPSTDRIDNMFLTLSITDWCFGIYIFGRQYGERSSQEEEKICACQ